MRINRGALTIAGVCVAGLLPSVAVAAPPGLLSVGQEAQHPTATFSAPLADDVTIYIASSPARATDGSFLTENVETLDILTDSEIQAGTWKSERLVDPGIYYVMLRASPTFSACYRFEQGGYDPACADGYSNVMTLAVPTPQIAYSTKATIYKNIRVGYLSLTAKPLGVDLRYDLCYRTKAKRKRCSKATIDAFSWEQTATDQLRVSLAGLAKRTVFTWYKRGTTKVLAKRTVVTG